MFEPQFYQFAPGRSCILFAKKTDRGDVFQQLWENAHTKEDQGLVRAADNTTHGKLAIRDVIWTELTKLLASENRDDTLYAIDQLNQMSGGGYDKINDFDRAKVLELIEPFIRSQGAEIAKSAISVLGSRNPYLSPDYAPAWLATIGKGHIDGWGTGEVVENRGAKPFWRSLVAVAEGDQPAEIRGLAILALGRTQEPELQDHLSRWLKDPEPLVRRAAAILLTDFPDLATDETIDRLMKDAEPPVRIGVARAIGFGQWADRVPQLAVLLNDSNPDVAEVAAMSLLSLPLESTRATMEANLEHSEYRPLFVNALARDNPQKYLEALSDIIRHDRRPEHWWGGSIPWGVSWNLLFDYAQQRPAELKQGKLNDILDAMESPDYFSSSEPRDLYALYVQQGMTARAKTFRAACRKRLTYDIDYFFDQVDKSPETYQRNR